MSIILHLESMKEELPFPIRFSVKKEQPCIHHGLLPYGYTVIFNDHSPNILFSVFLNSVLSYTRHIIWDGSVSMASFKKPSAFF